jgi:ASC-1-like (ASCH) protein
MSTGRTHKLKLDIEFCDAVLNGNKSFEIRINDRGFQKGDRIKFTPVRGSLPIVHEISKAIFEITYVLNGHGLKEDYVCLAIIKC